MSRLNCNYQVLIYSLNVRWQKFKQQIEKTNFEFCRNDLFKPMIYLNKCLDVIYLAKMHDHDI